MKDEYIRNSRVEPNSKLFNKFLVSNIAQESLNYNNGSGTPTIQTNNPSSVTSSRNLSKRVSASQKSQQAVYGHQ